MAIIAFSKGLLHGWLPQPFSAALQQAWRALAATIAGDGGVVGVVGEMGIQDCAAQCEEFVCEHDAVCNTQHSIQTCPP